MFQELDYYVKCIKEGLLIKERVPNKLELSKWLEIAKGSLTMKEFSARTNLNQVFLSRLKNGQIDRSLKIEEMYAIAANNCAVPYTAFINITFLQENENTYDAKDVIMMELIYHNGLEWKDNKISQVDKETINLRNRVRDMYTIIAEGIIQTGREIKQIMINDHSVPDKISISSHRIIDTFGGKLFYISGTSPEYHWYGCSINDISKKPEKMSSLYYNFMDRKILLDKFDVETAKRAEAFIKEHADMFLIDLINPEFLEIASYTFLLDDKVLFRTLCYMLDKMSFNNSFSLMLIDPKTYIGIIEEKHFKRVERKENGLT